MLTISCYKSYQAHLTLRLIRQTVKAILLSLVLIVYGFIGSQAQPNTWVQKNDLGYDDTNVPELVPRYSAVGFNIGNKGYIGTGYSQGLRNDFWEYDPAANTWTQKADFGGTARTSAVGFSIDTKGYIGTGWDGGYTKDFWEYDPTANIWTKKTDFGGSARYNSVGFCIDSKGYIGTGSSDTFPYLSKDFWEYDPATNSWMKKEDFGGGVRELAIGFSIESKGYIGTGWDDSYIPKKDFWEYDPATNTWMQKADFGGTGRISATGFSIGSKGYLGMGSNTNDFWEFDPSADTWTQKADFEGTARSDAVGFSIGNKGYIGTGQSGYPDIGVQKDFWEYDPSANTWIQKVGFVVTARYAAIGFNTGSKGYLGTGYSVTGFKKDFWEYDPATNSWTQKADFGGTPRASAVGFSIGNKGYVGTGYDNKFKRDFWEYDPVTNTWTQNADFGGIQRAGAVGFSIGNKGYIGTGRIGNNTLRDFWEYDPATNTWTQKADFSGGARSYAVGFSIVSKGYIGTGANKHSNYKDFYEYDVSTNTWTKKANFGGGARYTAVGFSVDNKGYIGTGQTGYGGEYKKDFWEYDTFTNTWTQKADFGGTQRSDAIGFSIGDKGYIGTGNSANGLEKDFWEYSPGGCPPPVNLHVSKISDTCVRLNWRIPNSSVEHIKIGYRKLGDSLWLEDSKKSSETNKVICGLTPNTTYEWEIRNICADDTTEWVVGPNFITTGVLPLQLTHFSITLQKTNALLNWKTIHEINTSYFNIQRSFNSVDFSTIAKQNATGNSSTQQYLYTDANVTALQQPKIFYRLQSVDKDGSSAYSNIVELNVSNTNGISFFVYPNPAKDKLHVSISCKANKNLSVRMVDMYGRQVYSENITAASDNFNYVVDIQKLAKGIYTIQLTNEKEETKTKFMKE